MTYIVTVEEAVTAFAPWREPTAAELDAIEAEMPVVLAEVAVLDAQIMTLDRPATELDTQRLRRAVRRVLTARRDLANLSAPAPVSTPGGAA